MTDESDPLDWFRRPQPGPTWMPDALWDGGLMSTSLRQVPARVRVDWEESPNGGAIARPSPLWNRGKSHWMESLLSTPPAGGNGGLLGNLGTESDGPPFNPGPEPKSIMPWPAWLRPVAPESLLAHPLAPSSQPPMPMSMLASGAGGWPSPNPPTAAAPSVAPPQQQVQSENAGAPISTTEDLLRTTPAALARGTTMALGGTGDARELAGKGIEWALRKAGIEPTSETVQRFKDALRSTPFGALIMGAPTSEQVLGALEENVTGALYKPQTQAGQYLNTALEFVPGAVALGPVAGGLRAIPGVALRYGLIPGLASEAAGQATEGTAAEPWARAGAALAAGGAAAFTHPSAPRGAAVAGAPERGASARPAVESPRRPAVADDVPNAMSGAPERATAYASHEAVPGKGTGHLPRLLDEPYAARELYSNDPRSSWTNPKTGGDVLYETLGLDTLPTRPATGSFTPGSGPLEINPAHVARPKIGMTPDGGAISDQSRELLKVAEHLRAYIDGQNMGAAHALTKNAPRDQLSSVDIPINRRINPTDMKKLTTIADPYGFHVSHRGYSPRSKPGQNAPEQVSGASDEGVSLINKGPSEGGRTAEDVRDLLKDHLEPRIKGVMGDAGRFESVKADSVVAEYEKLLAAANKGQRQATERLAKVLADAPPGTIEAFDRSRLFRDMAAARRARDAELEQTMGGVRDDLQRARAIIAERGLRGLLEALDRKEILPSVLVPLGLIGYGASSRGD